jgi:hypothetical protein
MKFSAKKFSQCTLRLNFYFFFLEIYFSCQFIFITSFCFKEERKKNVKFCHKKRSTRTGSAAADDDDDGNIDDFSKISKRLTHNQIDAHK